MHCTRAAGRGGRDLTPNLLIRLRVLGRVAFPRKVALSHLHKRQPGFSCVWSKFSHICCRAALAHLLHGDLQGTFSVPHKIKDLGTSIEELPVSAHFFPQYLSWLAEIFLSHRLHPFLSVPPLLVPPRSSLMC